VSGTAIVLATRFGRNGAVVSAKLIALEGIDGSGKGTQAAQLVQSLRQAGQRVELIGFPRYGETHFGRAVGDFLNGKFGSLQQVSPYLAATLYAGDRFESREMIAEAAAHHDFVVFDRYVASNMAHQGAKLDKQECERLTNWIASIEFEVFGLPRADLVILLDLPASTAQHLISKKQARSYTESKADLQEADGSYLDKVRAVYLQLAKTNPNWRKIQVLRNDTLRTVDEIGDEILDTVLAQFSGRK